MMSLPILKKLYFSQNIKKSTHYYNMTSKSENYIDVVLSLSEIQRKKALIVVT